MCWYNASKVEILAVSFLSIPMEPAYRGYSPPAAGSLEREPPVMGI